MKNIIIDVGLSSFGGPGNPYVMDDQAIPISQMEPPRTFTMHNGDKEAVIDFSGDEVTFSGDLPIDEAAKLFFNAVLGQLKPRCKTCHWYKSGSSHDHQCLCPKMLYGYGCKYDSIEPDEDSLAVENDEDWGMSPEPGFGCVHHKEKS